MVTCTASPCTNVLILKTKNDNVQQKGLSSRTLISTVSKNNSIGCWPLKSRSDLYTGRSSRAKWKACKKWSATLQKQFLEERAELLASKLRTTEEKALRAIIKAEESKQTFSQIKSILIKQNFPLSQVNVLSQPNDTTSPVITLTNKGEIEAQILTRNQRHSRQSLNTPFFTNPTFRDTMHPFLQHSALDAFTDGTFLQHNDLAPLTPAQREWISSLKKLVQEEITLNLSIEDFQAYFWAKSEGTSSSPSGGHTLQSHARKYSLQ